MVTYSCWHLSSSAIIGCKAFVTSARLITPVRSSKKAPSLSVSTKQKVEH